MATHTYPTTLSWSGSTGQGPPAFSRGHSASAPPAEAVLALSADAAFRGDANLLNPEQLLVMAASSCQMLSFLSEAAQHGLDVRHYDDQAEGVMDDRHAPVRISTITLSPTIGVAAGTDGDEVLRLVASAHERCYIANSLTTQITVHPTLVDA